MLTKMTEEDWEIVLEVFDAAQSERGEPGHDDRKFLEALHYFTVHSITWRALPAEFGNWNSSRTKRLQEGIGQLRHVRHGSILRTPSGPGGEVRCGSAWRLMATTLPLRTPKKARKMAAFGVAWVGCGGGFRLPLNQRLQGSSPCAPTKFASLRHETCLDDSRR